MGFLVEVMKCLKIDSGKAPQLCEHAKKILIIHWVDFMIYDCISIKLLQKTEKKELASIV